jgi:hypothetical protein
VGHSLAFWLLAIAAVLLPVDVAARRLVFRRSDAELWAALLRRTQAPVEVEQTLGRLRQTVGQGRTRRAAAASRAPTVSPEPASSRGFTAAGEPAAARDSAASSRPEPAAAGQDDGESTSPEDGGGDLAARLVARRRKRGR